MTISPGDSWGSVGYLPAETPVVEADAALAALVASGGGGPVLAALAGGDLCRTLGGRGDVSSRLGADTTLADVNVGELFVSDEYFGPFVAHVVCRGRFWHGPAAVVMNAQWLGEWDLAPRAHPGDGLFDATQGQLGLRERAIARRRAVTGDHLPHPGLRSSRAPRFEFEFDRDRLILRDGEEIGRHRRIRVEMRKEPITVAV